MSNLEGRRIIVTGAASGIGRATCVLAAQQGARVLAVDYADKVEETVQEISAAGGTAIAIRADVSDEEAVAAFVQRCVDEWGGVDGTFANAGVGGAGKPFHQLSKADWMRTLGINTVGTFFCAKHSLTHMLPAKGGSIVCTSSVAGIRANAGGVDYSASKAAIISMVQTMAYQLYGTGIRINAVCPGLIETGMTRGVFALARHRGREDRIGQINPSARAGQPVEIAEMACFLLSDAASYVNGQAIAVDGGLSASHPWAFPRKKDD